MMHRTLFGCVIVVLGLQASAEAEFLSVQWLGDPGRFAPESETFSEIGNSGVDNHFNGLARHDGRYIGYNDLTLSGGSHALFGVDPKTGAATKITNLQGVSEFISSLAASPGDGTLYGVDSGDTDRLVTVSTATGELTEVGTLSTNDIQGLAFNPSGELFAWGNDLLMVDPDTAKVTDVDPTTDGDMSGGQSIAFTPDGELYGAGSEPEDAPGLRNDQFYKINPETGATTPILTADGASIRGMEFAEPAAVPEPATMGLLSVGAFSVLVGGRSRRSRKTEVG